MQVFISHSQKDETLLKMLQGWLNKEEITYWDSAKMLAGTSLSDQLIHGIKESDVCIFIATQNSINSSEWCKAELGAFWSASKKVIIFVGDDKVNKDHIPPQFQYNLWTTDYTKVIESVKHYIKAGSKKNYGIKIDSHKNQDKVEFPIELSGIYNIEPVSENIIAIVLNPLKNEYWPKNDIVFFSDHTWSTQIEIGGGYNEERIIRIAAIGACAKIIANFHKEASKNSDIPLIIKPNYINHDIHILDEIKVTVIERKR